MAIAMDRARQLALLEAMRATYPNKCDYFGDELGSAAEVIATLCYLIEHGLCVGEMQESNHGILGFLWVRITARGLDFLADDGGLTAILGVVTVRLDADTLRELIGERIEALPVPAEEKSRLRSHLAKLSEAALKEATTALVRLGLSNLPDAMTWLQRLLAHGGIPPA